jgi:hypothetical protein
MSVSRSNAPSPRVHFDSLGLPSSKLAALDDQQKSHDFENNQRNVGAHVLSNAPICDNNASLYPDPILWQKCEPPNEGNHKYISTKICDDVSLESTAERDAKENYMTFNHQDMKKEHGLLGSSNLNHNVNTLNSNAGVSSQSKHTFEDEYSSTHRNTKFASKSCVDEDNEISVPVYETIDINPNYNVVFKRQESTGIFSEAHDSVDLEHNNMLEEHCSLRDKSKFHISGASYIKDNCFLQSFEDDRLRSKVCCENEMSVNYNVNQENRIRFSTDRFLSKENEYHIPTETNDEDKLFALKGKEYIHSFHYNSSNSKEQSYDTSVGNLCVDVAAEKCSTASIKRHQLLLIHKNLLG